MNNRIYPKSVFDKAIKDFELKLNNYYCPKCFNNNCVSDVDKETGTIYLEQYKCHNCSSLFDFSDALTKQDVRNKKIDIVLKSK